MQDMWFDWFDSDKEDNEYYYDEYCETVGRHEKNYSLHKACRAGNTGMVEYLLTLGIHHDNPDQHDKKPLDIACSKGHVDIVLLLLQTKNHWWSGRLSSCMLDVHISQAIRGSFFPVIRVLAMCGAVWWDEGDTKNKWFLSRGLEGIPSTQSWLRKRTFWSQLHFACEVRDIDFVQKYLASDCSCLLPQSTTSTVVFEHEDEKKNERETAIRGWTPIQCASLQISKRYSMPVNKNLAAIIKAAYNPWSSNNHRLYPKSFRRIVLTMLLVVHRKFGVNSDILSAIFCFAGRDWWKPEWVCDMQYRRNEVLTDYEY